MFQPIWFISTKITLYFQLYSSLSNVTCTIQRKDFACYLVFLPCEISLFDSTHVLNAFTHCLWYSIISVSVPTLHKHMCWKFPTLLTHTKWLCSVRPFIPFTRIFCSESFYTLLTYILLLLIMGLFVNHQLYMLKAFPYYFHT